MGARVHSIPSLLSEDVQSSLGSSSRLAVSETLGIAVVVREVLLDTFLLVQPHHSQQTSTNAQDPSVRFPFLGSKTVAESPRCSIEGVKFLNSSSSQNDFDLLAVVANGQLVIFQLEFFHWFKQVDSQWYENPLRWRIRFRFNLSSNAGNTLRVGLKSFDGCRKMYQQEKKESGALQYQICIGSQKEGMIVVEYKHFERVKEQIEAPKPRVVSLKEVIPVAACADGKHVLIVEESTHRVLLWRPSVLLPSEAQHKMTLPVVIVDGESVSPLGDAIHVSWIIPGELFWVIHKEGTRNAYRILPSFDVNSVQVSLEATYPSLSENPSGNWHCSGSVSFATSTPNLAHVWSVAGAPSKKHAGSLLLYGIRFAVDLSNELFVQSSSLYDVLNTGFIRVPGSTILGAHLCPLVNRGPQPSSATPLSSAIQTSCHFQRDLNGIGVILLTDAGLCTVCIPLPLSVPKASGERTKPEKHARKKSVTFDDQSTKGLSPCEAPASSESSQPPSMKPSTRPKHSKLNLSLADTVKELKQRIKQTELDLIHLRTDFIAFTTEVSKSMADLVAQINLGNNPSQK